MKETIMKKIFAILSIAALAFVGVSCNPDRLTLENPNALTAETAFNSEGDIDLTLTSCYHSFYSSYYSMMSSNQFSGQSDECTTYSTVDLQNYIGLKYPNYSWNWNNCTWNQLYQQVFRCNQVINFAEQNVTEWKNYDKNQILAQAKAIRAFAYYQLTMLYRKAPYIDWVSSAGDKPAESDFDTLCQKIVEDAEFAYKTLPGSYMGSECRPEYKGQYRVTKWFAACVLGKTYMNWNNQYSKALPYYKDIVNNGGFKLVADFNDNFNITTENNAESIFEIQNYADKSGAGAAYYGRTNNGASPDRGMWRWKFYGMAPLGWNDYSAEAWTLAAFKNEKTVKDTPTTKAGQYDPRLEATLMYYGIFDDFPGHVQWGYTEESIVAKNKANPAYASKWQMKWDLALWGEDKTARVSINKYVAQYEDGVQVNSDNCEGTNNRIFRLGEIMLDYAECLAQTGDLKGAVDQIDKVRDRAGLAKLADRVPVESIYLNSETGDTTDMNAEFAYSKFVDGTYTLADIITVLDIEDMKETAFECERFVDQRRWGIGEMGAYFKKVTKRSLKFKENFEAFKVWLPIPTAEVSNNENLSQNEGY